MNECSNQAASLFVHPTRLPHAPSSNSARDLSGRRYPPNGGRAGYHGSSSHLDGLLCARLPKDRRDTDGPRDCVKKPGPHLVGKSACQTSCRCHRGDSVQLDPVDEAATIAAQIGSGNRSKTGVSQRFCVVSWRSLLWVQRCNASSQEHGAEMQSVVLPANFL